MSVLVAQQQASQYTGPQSPVQAKHLQKPPALSKTTVNGTEYLFDAQKALKSGADGDVYIAKRSPESKHGPATLIIKKAKMGGVAEQANEVSILSAAGQSGGIISSYGRDSDENLLFLEKGDGALNDSELVQSKSVASRLGMAKNVGLGISHLHSKNITHQDINTKNMIVFGSSAKLTDFGNSISFGEKPSVVKLDGEAQMLMQAVPEMRADIIRGATITKASAVKGDIQDYVKATYNIIAGKTDDLVIPSNFVEELAPHKATLGQKYDNLVALFTQARQGTYPGSIDAIRALL